MDSLFQLTRSLDDFQNILDYEKENFESKFRKLKEGIAVCEGVIKTFQQKSTGSEEAEIQQKIVNEDLQIELEDVKQKLKDEETKSKGLEQDVDELNALVDLYVRESEKRDYLNLKDKCRDKIAQKLKLKIKGLEEEMFCKIGKIHNLENTIIELRRELSKKDEEIANLHEKLASSCKV